MSTEKKVVLFAMLCVLIVDASILVYGAKIGHIGLFEFGADVGKVAFGTVLGALASAFSGKA
jgi:hypothetical protein